MPAHRRPTAATPRPTRACSEPSGRCGSHAGPTSTSRFSKGAEDPNGDPCALDGRLLFLHAKTAGCVAAAELRHQLAARLGIEHGAVARGIAPVLGVPEHVVARFSTRSREIDEAVEALGVDSAPARQVAAYDTRSAKEKGFDFDKVTAWWGETMDGLGFDEAALDGVLHASTGPAS